MSFDLNRVQAAFDAVRGMPADARDAYFATHHADEPELRAEVEALLRAVDTDDHFLSAPARVGSAPDTAALGSSAGSATGDLVGRTVGPYELRRFIAGGGMGVVYEGWQPSLRRRVAVKLMRSPFETEALKRRFDFEGRVLARLQHPNIASIHDAGVFESEATGLGLPYFAMEFVDEASTLDEYVRDRSLFREERLRLFATICDAVHYGHSRGVIHRDLKPGNILVDRQGVPKLIDFGLARSLEDDAADRSVITKSGHVMGTIRYMSPEQVSGQTDDIDTRTDVYALGVILYELLCDAHPYLDDATGFSEAAQAIREKPPVRPTRVTNDLPRDLESIVLQALAKERDRRYASVAAFGEDVRRFLDRRPVSARPPSVVDQVRLFVQRHRALSAALAIAVISLIAATGISAYFAVTAERARRDQAREADAAKKARSAEASAREAERARADESERLLAEAQHFSGWVIHKLQHRLIGLPNASDLRKDLSHRIVAHLERLLEIGVSRASTRRMLALAFVETSQVQGAPRVSNVGDVDGALKSLRTAKRLLTEHIADQPNDDRSRQRLAMVDVMMADIAAAKGDPAAGETYRASLRILDGMLASRPDDLELHQHLAWVHGGLANVAAMNDDMDSEVRHRDQAIAHWETILAREPDDTTAGSGLIAAATGLADSLLAAERYDRVPALLARADRLAGTLATRKTFDGEFDLATVRMLDARLAFAEDRRTDGRKHSLAAIDLLRTVVNRDPKNAAYLGHLGRALRLGTALASDDEREDFLEEAIDIHRKLLDLTPNRVMPMRSLGFNLFLFGRHLLRVGRVDEALDPLEEAGTVTADLLRVAKSPIDYQTLVDASMLFARYALRKSRDLSGEERTALITRAANAVERAKDGLPHLPERERAARARDLQRLARALDAMRK